MCLQILSNQYILFFFLSFLLIFLIRASQHLDVQSIRGNLSMTRVKGYSNVYKCQVSWWDWPSEAYLHGSVSLLGEGNGTPLQYSCLGNPMDGGAWWAAVHGVAKSQTRLSYFTFTFHFHTLEREMATHSSVLARRIQGMGGPGRLPSMGSHRVGHNWSDLAVTLLGKKAGAFWFCLWDNWACLGYSPGQELLCLWTVWWRHDGSARSWSEGRMTQ